jgi:hypothetical protein
MQIETVFAAAGCGPAATALPAREALPPAVLRRAQMTFGKQNSEEVRRMATLAHPAVPWAALAARMAASVSAERGAAAAVGLCVPGNLLLVRLLLPVFGAPACKFCQA